MPDPIAAALAVARTAPPSANVADNVTGGLHSPVAGRTDALPISVPNGAYVIPADIVSALGQGNSQAGMRALDRMFSPGPTTLPPGGRVNIAAAGGEYIVPPNAVAALGNGDMKAGHAVLDTFVKQVRASTVKHLASIPGPRGS